ncbi:MAG: hypothetical protein LKKZDAJK_000107 [Candidatus Fervidibacter sp.]|jgi:Protein of unknown function (DUF3500).
MRWLIVGAMGMVAGILGWSGFRPLASASSELPKWQKEALAIWEALTAEQRQKVLQPFDAPFRREIRLPGGPRPGILIGTLNANQQALVVQLVRVLCSEKGAEKVLALMRQEQQVPEPRGIGSYTLTFFGDPKGEPFAVRIAGHHLTLLRSRGDEWLGPVVLGSNPHLNNTKDWLWDGEETLAVQLWQALTDEQRKQAHDPTTHPDAFRGVPSEFAGLPVQEMSGTQKRLVRQLVEERLSVLANDWAQEFREALKAEGGIEALTLAYAGNPVRPIAQGGRFAYRLRGRTFRMEFWNWHGHMHLTLEARR